MSDTAEMLPDNAMARLRALQAAHNVLRDNEHRVFKFISDTQTKDAVEQAAAMVEYRKIMSKLAHQAQVLINQMTKEALKDDPLKNGGEL